MNVWNFVNNRKLDYPASLIIVEKNKKSLGHCIVIDRYEFSDFISGWGILLKYEIVEMYFDVIHNENILVIEINKTLFRKIQKTENEIKNIFEEE